MRGRQVGFPSFLYHFIILLSLSYSTKKQNCSLLHLSNDMDTLHEKKISGKLKCLYKDKRNGMVIYGNDRAYLVNPSIVFFYKSLIINVLNQLLKK